MQANTNQQFVTSKETVNKSTRILWKTASATKSSQNSPSNDQPQSKEAKLSKYQENLNENSDLELLDDFSFSKFSVDSNRLSMVTQTNNNIQLLESSKSLPNRSPNQIAIGNRDNRSLTPKRARYVFPIKEESSREETSKFEEGHQRFDQEFLISEKLRDNPQLNRIQSTPRHQRTSSVKVSLTPAQKFERKNGTSSQNALDDFQLMLLVGTGAFASVYKAKNLRNNEIVAIKQIRLEKDQDVAVITNEIDLLKILKHPKIVKYHGFVKTSNTLNIVLEYCSRGSLRQLYKKLRTGLPEKQIAEYTKQILQGLSYLHDQGVVHRDVKAANLLLMEDGDVKLADFGVATKVNSQHHTLVGTPNWMAPETILGGDGICTASDIWSLGATIIELYTTHPPYHDLNAMAALHAIGTEDHPPIPRNISLLAKEFLLECFQKQPNLRINAKLLLKHRWLNQEIVTERSAINQLEKPRPSMDMKSIKNYSEIQQEDNWEEDFPEMKFPKNLESTGIHSIVMEPDDQSIVIPTKLSKTELLDKFVDGSKDEFADSSMGNVFDTLKISGINKDTNEEKEEVDPFLNLQIDNFDTNEIEIQNKMEYLVNKLARKLEEVHRGSEVAVETLVKVTGRMLHLIKKYPVSHDTFIRDHGVLSLLELLESFSDFPKQQKLWVHSLSILNFVFENNNVQLESFCFLGGIPIIAHFRSGSYELQVRLQVARFIKCVNNSNKALSMFVSCGGLRLVSRFVEEDFDTEPTFPLVSIDCIHKVLTNDLSRSKSDLCRILSKHGVLFWFAVLLNRLVKYDKNPYDIPVQATINKIMDIMKYFSESETRVRMSIASADLFKVIIKSFKNLNATNNQLIVLKFLKSMSCIGAILKQLYDAEIVEFLVHVFEKFVPSTNNYREIINVAGPILYNCLLLNRDKEIEFVANGGLKRIKNLSVINLPFRQFILPVLCELVYCKGQVRNELKKNNILNVYYNLLLDPYWQSNALDSIYHWHQTDPKYIDLNDTIAKDCFMAGFLLPKVSNLESTLDIYLQLITTNIQFTKVMSKLVIFNNILMKISVFKRNPVIALQLMKILKRLVEFSVEQNNDDLDKISQSIINMLESSNLVSTSVLIDEVATEILSILS